MHMMVTEIPPVLLLQVNNQRRSRLGDRHFHIKEINNFFFEWVSVSYSCIYIIYIYTHSNTLIKVNSHCVFFYIFVKGISGVAGILESFTDVAVSEVLRGSHIRHFINYQSIIN